MDGPGNTPVTIDPFPCIDTSIPHFRKCDGSMGLLLKIRSDLAGKFFEIAQFSGDGFINCPVIQAPVTACLAPR